MKIIDNKVRALVQRIELSRYGESVDHLLRELVLRLKDNCSQQAVVDRYQSYHRTVGTIKKLPVDQLGYIAGCDVLTDETAFVKCWREHGIVVSRNVLSIGTTVASVACVAGILRKLSGDRFDIMKPDTWSSMPVDKAGVPALSRGFFEVYHDAILADLRQAVRVYLHYVLILGRPDLWTTFDRLGIKLPGHEESKALPLHVDQNPNVHPDFRTVQGVLALTNCPAERGTFVGVPGSKRCFQDYGRMAKNKGEYVELDLSDPIATKLRNAAQVCPLRAGDLISWDSRTTHANSENVSDKFRMVAYIAAGLAREDDKSALKARLDGFKTGLGSNDRDALMHASKKPRYTDPKAIARARAPEKFTLLGRLLYGQKKYADI